LTSEPSLTLDDVRIGGSRIVITPHNCFACGSLNAHGLHLELHAAGERCWTEVTLDRRFEGWEGIAHGGIVATILDEVMAWSLVDHDLWGLTARMSVDFRKPVRIGQPIRGEGRVTGVRRRLVDAEGMLLDAGEGTVLATSHATYVSASEERKRELKARYAFRLEPDGTSGGAAAGARAAAPGTPEPVEAG
jgi:uncharacterized protein (TIGR00369 family)